MSGVTSSRARDHYKLGTRQYAQGEYAEAIGSFDRALALGDKSSTYVMLDGKAAAMNKLDEWRRQAYEVAVKLCRDYGRDGKNAFKPWYRKSDILRCMGMYTQALESLDHAVSLSTTQPGSVQTTLSNLRTSILHDRSEANRRRLDRETDEGRRQALLEAARKQAKKAKINYVQHLPPDVLVCIAEQGLAVKMGMVCRHWREVVCSSPGLWGSLTVGKGRPVAKARLWVERSGGRIRELRVEEGFDERIRGQELITTLEDSLEWVKSLVIDNPRARDIVDATRGRFLRLERLVIQGHGTGFPPGPNTPFGLDLGLLPSFASALRHVELFSLSLDPSFDFPTPSARSADSPIRKHDRRFEKVKTVRLERCCLAGDSNDHTLILKLCPAAQHLTLLGNSWRQGVSVYPSQTHAKSFTHESLSSYSENGRPDGGIRFQHLKTPSLTALDFYSCGFIGPNERILHQILAPGLSLARAQLTSLDIGKNDVGHDDLMVALAELPKLRFLGVSFCPLGNRFLDTLQRKEEENGLVPHLTALSIAGNPDITAGAVRDLVTSRLPPELRILRTRPVVPPKRSSSFLPSGARPNQSATDAPETEPSRSRSQSQPQSSSQHAPGLSCITWLNLDACDRIEAGAAALLRKNVRFVSNVFGNQVVEDRIRGKHAWAWDSDGSEDCGDGQADACQLRPVAGEKDKWYVKHVCNKGRAQNVEEVGWEWSSQTSSSRGPAKRPRTQGSQ